MARKVEMAIVCALLGAVLVLLVEPAQALADPAGSHECVKMEKARLLEKQAVLMRDEAALLERFASLRQRQADLLAEKAQLMAQEARMSTPPTLDSQEENAPDVLASALSPAVELEQVEEAVDTPIAPAEPDAVAAGPAPQPEADDSAVRDELGWLPEIMERGAEWPLLEASDDWPLDPVAPPIDATAPSEPFTQTEEAVAAALAGSSLREALRLLDEQAIRAVSWLEQWRMAVQASPAPPVLIDPLPTMEMDVRQTVAEGGNGAPASEWHEATAEEAVPPSAEEGHQEAPPPAPDAAPVTSEEPAAPASAEPGTEPDAQQAAPPSDATPETPTPLVMPQSASEDAARLVNWVRKIQADLAQRWRTSPFSPMTRQMLGRS